MKYILSVSTLFITLLSACTIYNYPDMGVFFVDNHKKLDTLYEEVETTEEAHTIHNQFRLAANVYFDLRMNKVSAQDEFSKRYLIEKRKEWETYNNALYLRRIREIIKKNAVE